MSSFRPAPSGFRPWLRRRRDWLQHGDEADSLSGVPHLASALACIGIILDARARGVLVDDRPPPIPGFSASIDAMEADVRRVLEVFAARTATA